jgi:hypothetical protein
VVAKKFNDKRFWGVRQLAPNDTMDTFVKLALEKIVKASTKKDEELRAASVRVAGSVRSAVWRLHSFTLFPFWRRPHCCQISRWNVQVEQFAASFSNLVLLCLAFCRFLPCCLSARTREQLSARVTFACCAFPQRCRRWQRGQILSPISVSV